MLTKIPAVLYPLVAVGLIVLVYVNGDIDGPLAIGLAIGALGLSAAPSFAGK